MALLLLGASAPTSREDGSPQPPPGRIVSLAPSLTEILFALGEGDRVVGVTRYDDYPPAVLHLPRVGGPLDPSLEAILSLRPQVVVGLDDRSVHPIYERVKSLSVPVFLVPGTRVDDALAAIRALGDLLACPDRAETVVREVESTLAAVRRRTASLPRPRVLLLYGHRPLIAAGPGTFGDELIRLAGGENVLQEGPRYPSLSLERVLSLAPEVIVDAVDHQQDTQATWSRWKTIPAVESGRVHRVDPSLLGRPGPRLGRAVSLLAELLHPTWPPPTEVPAP